MSFWGGFEDNWHKFTILMLKSYLCHLFIFLSEWMISPFDISKL